MKCTTFAQRQASRPGRARVGVCVRTARPVAVDAPAAVGLRLRGGAYHSWQLTGIAPTTNGAFTMSTKCRTRTLGTSPT